MSDPAARKERAERLLEGATSAPWMAYFNTHGDPYVVPRDASSLASRICDVSVAPEDYGKGNALLIAAAPDLAADVIALADEVEALRAAMLEAARHIEANHRLDIEPGWCRICGSSDGHWPCIAAEATGDLRAALSSSPTEGSQP